MCRWMMGMSRTKWSLLFHRDTATHHRRIDRLWRAFGNNQGDWEPFVTRWALGWAFLA